MHLNFLTLKRQSHFLGTRAAGAKIHESFTQVKNEWILRLLSRDEDELFLQLSCHPRYPFIIINNSITRQQNSTTVMGGVAGLRIKDLTTIPGERILKMTFVESKMALMIHMFTTNSNFFLIDENGSTINSFKKSKSLKGKGYSIPESSRLDISAIPLSEFIEIAQREPEEQLAGFLKSTFFHLSQTVIRELFFRLDIPGNAIIQSLTTDQMENLYKDSLNFLKACQEDQPEIYFQEKLPHTLSLTHLQHLSWIRNPR